MSKHSDVGMARGIPRPSFLEVPDLFSLLDSPKNRFYHSSDPLFKIRIVIRKVQIVRLKIKTLKVRF